MLDSNVYYDQFTLGHIRFIQYKRGLEKIVTWALDGTRPGISLPPTPLNRFDIGPHDTVHALQVRAVKGHGPSPPLPIEPREESDDEGDADYNPDIPETSGKSWQQQETQQLSDMTASFIQVQRSHSERILALENRVSTMISYQESLMDYYARLDGDNFRDPMRQSDPDPDPDPGTGTGSTPP